MTHLPRDLESRSELVESVMAVLRPAERRLLQLHYFEDVGCDTLARIFCTTTSAIHVRLFRARERFRTVVHELGAGATNEHSVPVPDSIL